MHELKRLLDDCDSFAAAAWIEQQGPPQEAVEMYRQAALWLYNEHKDVPGMVAVSHAGIQFGLDHARRCAATDPEASAKLKGTAKAIAFNLGSNTWTGWNDDGIILTDSDLRAGLDEARLNLRLAVELERGDEPLAIAYWLLGAHELARGRCATANEQFHTAAAHAAATGKQDMELMLRGYEALAGLRADPAAEAARRDFDSRVDALRAGGSDDGRFYAGQLSTARDVFTGRAAQSADRP